MHLEFRRLSCYFAAAIAYWFKMNAGQEDKCTPLEKHICYRNVDKETCSLFCFGGKGSLLLKGKKMTCTCLWSLYTESMESHFFQMLLTLDTAHYMYGIWNISCQIKVKEKYVCFWNVVLEANNPGSSWPTQFLLMFVLPLSPRHQNHPKITMKSHVWHNMALHWKEARCKNSSRTRT